jgi:hypothetical protein
MQLFIVGFSILNKRFFLTTFFLLFSILEVECFIIVVFRTYMENGAVFAQIFFDKYNFRNVLLFIIAIILAIII